MRTFPRLFLLATPIALVYGGIPIRYPDCGDHPNCQYYEGPPFNEGGKNVPYNLIDTDPICWYRGWCPMFPPGSRLAAFPNSEEKFNHVLNNIHRMFSNQSLSIPICKYFDGVNPAKETVYCDTADCSFCGEPDWSYHDLVAQRRPQFWYSDANQAARFKQFDYTTCKSSWWSVTGITAHSTCGDGQTFEEDPRVRVTSKFGTEDVPTDRCLMIADDCSFEGRASTFCHEDNCWFETEGICGSNTCVTDAHCDPIFGKAYDFVGKGFVENMNGVASQFSLPTGGSHDDIFYPLVAATHFDERYKVAPADFDADGNHWWFMLEYFDTNKTQFASTCWLLYDGEAHEMDVLLSNAYKSGTYGRDYYVADQYTNQDFSVMYRLKLPPTSSCAPYAFVCATVDAETGEAANIYRLPEEEHYFFGTEFLDWSWSDYAADFGIRCHENHYYCPIRDENDNNRCMSDEWLVNGGPSVPVKEDIWYYSEPEFGSCVGCGHIEVLECLSDCILAEGGAVNCNCYTTPAPTSDFTCVDIVEFSTTWRRVNRDPGEPYALYRPDAEEAFLMQYPECLLTLDTMEYFYDFTYRSNSNPSQRVLTVNMYVCCGDSATFGAAFVLPASNGVAMSRYAANEVYESRYAGTSVADDTSWTDPTKFGAKQYVVFSIVGVLILVCCFGGVCFMYYQAKNRPRKTNQARIQMHDSMAVAGRPTFELTRTDEPIVAPNGYINRLVHNDFTDGSMREMMPPKSLFGKKKHTLVPTASSDSPVTNTANVLSAPPFFSLASRSIALPPPTMELEDSAAEEMEQLDSGDVAEAFEVR